MAPSNTTARSGIYVYTALFAPTRLIAPMPEACMHWLQQQVCGTQSLPTDREVDAVSTRHPSFGMFAAFGCAKLERTAGGVALSDLNISVGSETQALALANSVLGQEGVFTVTYAGQDCIGKMVGARSLMLGLPLPNRQRSSSQSNLDLTDIVSLGGLAPIPPLPVALAQMHRDLWHPELSVAETVAALQENNHRPVIQEVLWRLLAISRMYVSMYVGREDGVSFADPAVVDLVSSDTAEQDASKSAETGVSEE